MLQVAVHPPVDTIRRGYGGQAVAHRLYLVGVVAKLQQRTVDEAVATIVKLHSTVGEHHIVGTEQLLHQVDVGHFLIVGVIIDGIEVVPIAEMRKEVMY